MKQGFFITLEGIDGVGKSTQAKKLSDTLKQEGYRVVTTREPGGSEIGDSIRNILLNKKFNEMTPQTEVLLYAASRSEHVQKLIKPLLIQGKIVISDRYIDSSLAYQGIAGQVGENLVLTVNQIAIDGLWPDLTIVLDVDPVELEKRDPKSPKGKDRIELKGLSYQIKVREAFRLLAERYPERIEIVDGNGSVEQVHKRILNCVRSKFDKKGEKR